MNKEILVVGSINVDTTIYLDRFPKEGETINASYKSVAAGGKGSNQAFAAKRSGANVHFLTALGKDQEGDFLLPILQKEGLDQNVIFCDLPTGNATILVNQAGQNEIMIMEGANGFISPVVIEEKRELFEKAQFIVLQNEISMATNEYILKRYGDSKTILYNPAPAKKISQEALRKAAYLIPNETELALLTGTSNIEEGARYLLSLGVKNVLVTVGSQGSYLFNSKGQHHCAPHLVKAIDTVAAGDTYLGYFVGSLAQGLSSEKAMETASKASAIAVTKKGALPSIPTKEEVQAAHI